MISIIVPIYNAEHFLEEAIESVFNQTCKDWELILVDDGSTDSSPYICDKASQHNPKIKVIHKPNGGLSSARNAGLDIATGDSLTFLDADDFLSCDAFKIVNDVNYKFKADIVCGSIVKFKNTGHHPFPCSNSNYSFFNIKTLSPLDAIQNILYQREIDNSVSGKIYSMHLFKNLRFRENTGYEDLDIFYKIFQKANKIIKIENILYFYRQHSGSYIHNFSLGRADVLDVTQRLSAYMEKNIPSLLPAAHSRELSANFNILGLIAANGSYSKETDFIADKCWKKIKELRGECMRNPSVRLKNKIGVISSYLFGRRGVELLSKLIY